MLGKKDVLRFFLVVLLGSLCTADRMFAQLSFERRVFSLGRTGIGDKPTLRSIAGGNLTGNGHLDLAVAGLRDIEGGGSIIAILVNMGRGMFEVGEFSPPVEPSSNFVTIADLTGHGFNDLAVASGESNTVSILEGNGDGTFKEPQSYAVSRDPRSIAVGDFDGDGFLDLAVAHYLSRSLLIMLNNGDGTFRLAAEQGVGAAATSVTMSDFDGDEIPDFAVTGELTDGPHLVSILLGNKDGTFRSDLYFAVGRNPLGVTAADFNGDAIPDLAVANAGSDSVSILLGIGDGTFEPGPSLPAGRFPVSVAVADFNGDKIPDLAVANSGSDTLSIFLGKGDGTFGPAQDFEVGEGPVSIAVGDFNGDDLPDLAVANRMDSTVTILINGGGTPK